MSGFWSFRKGNSILHKSQEDLYSLHSLSTTEGKIYMPWCGIGAGHLVMKGNVLDPDANIIDVSISSALVENDTIVPFEEEEGFVWPSRARELFFVLPAEGFDDLCIRHRGFFTEWGRAFIYYLDYSGKHELFCREGAIDPDRIALCRTYCVIEELHFSIHLVDLPTYRTRVGIFICKDGQLSGTRRMYGIADWGIVGVFHVTKVQYICENPYRVVDSICVN